MLGVEPQAAATAKIAMEWQNWLFEKAEANMITSLAQAEVTHVTLTSGIKQQTIPC